MSVCGELGITDFHFTWKIQDFSKKCKNIEDQVFSPIFKIGSAKTETQWRLFAYPYGYSEIYKDHLSLFLQLVSVNYIWLSNYAFKLYLLDDAGNRTHECCSKLRSFSGLNSYGFPLFLKKDILMEEKNSLLVDDVLTICCSISFNLYSAGEFNEENMILSDYETLYTTKHMSDLTIVIGAKKIKAHKNILSIRNQVFSAMFQHDMLENTTNTIEIDDVTYEVMDELLLFIYCGKVRNIKKLAPPLLIAADKYGISLLKMMCERTLFENLQVENACETLVIADRFNCAKLKSESMSFIVKNIKSIISTSKFKELKVSEAQLLEEILCKVAEKVE